MHLHLIAQTTPYEFIYGDRLPDGPKLSHRGVEQVGVRTLVLHHPNRLDVLNSTQDKDVFYDRPLQLEIWYPAVLKADEQELEVYEEVMGNYNDPERPLLPFQFQGRAKRNA